METKTITPTTPLEAAVREAQLTIGDGEDWEYGLPAVMQRLLDRGQAFLMEGTCGRMARDLLHWGAVFLPDEQSTDYYGSIVPARSRLPAGASGTLEHCAAYYGISTTENKTNNT